MGAALSRMDTLDQPDLRGQAVPIEGPSKPTIQDPRYGDLGPNMENLKDANPQLVQALFQLIDTYRTEGIVARRHEIRRIRQARLFWQGIQQGYFDKDSGLWQLPFGSSLGLGVSMDNNSDVTEQPRYSFVTNYYLAYGLAFASLVSQDVPTVRFWPRKPSNIIDITASKACSEAAELIEQLNNIQDKLTELGYMLWTDGKVGSYVRYVVDGEKFGYDERDDMQEDYSKLGEDSYVCPNCGAETPEQGMMGAPVCQQCGQPLSVEDFKAAEMIPVPGIQGSRKTPRGQEVIDFIGGLELNTPVWAKEQHQFPYLQWQLEVHRAKLKASYPHVADKLETQYPSGAEDVYARASRLSVAQGLPFTHPGDALYSLITFLRTWIRPWSFYDIKDREIRDEALRLFPNGCYIAFAGEVYCEARAEGLDDKWRVVHAYPGEGQSRPSVGDPMIDIQEQYNSYANILAENAEFGIPPVYADPETLDFDALPDTTVEPAAMYPARKRQGEPLGNSFFSPAPTEVSQQMVVYMEQLVGPISQMLTGLFPAVFGGSMEDIKTAKAYAIARDQALGRLGLVWRRIKEFYAETMMLAVECFRDNRPEDVEVPIFREDGKSDYKTIMLTDLKGQVEAYPEPDETFPRLKSEQRAVVQQLMQAEDPEIQTMLGHPANLGLIKGLLGLQEFIIPDEDSRNKQLREIDELLQAAPIPAVGISPLGQPTQEMQPTVEIDPVLDNHLVEFAECQRWANSEEGQEAKVDNPAGFSNVRAHALQHFQLMKMQAMQAQAAQAPPEEPPKEGE